MIRKEVFHSMIVHFPIALLIFSYVLFIAWRATGREAAGQGAYWTLLAGSAGALAAAMSGFVAQSLAPHTEKAHEILTRFHQPIGLAVLALSVALAAWAVLSRLNFTKVASAIFITVFTALICLLAAEGYYGGLMVYEHGMGISSSDICSSQTRQNHGQHGKSEEKDSPAPAHGESSGHAGHDMRHKH